MSNFSTSQELVLAAHRNLSKTVWDYVTYGTESETTVLRNRQALDSIALLPRVLVDVSLIDCATTLVGVPLRIPVILAPIGSLALINPRAALPVAEAVAEFGTFQVLSEAAAPGYQAVAAQTKAALGYGYLGRNPHAELEELIPRIVDAGFKAIVVTSEAPYYSRRERDLINQLKTGSTRERTYASFMQQQRAELSEGKVASKDGLIGGTMTWKLLRQIKAKSGLPLILKGITTAADAKLAVEHGVDVVYVSNHGGRALDHARGSMDALPEVVAAVKGAADVIVDGGFVRGSDILKAIATGAKAVAVGRMQAWALAAAGSAGVVRMLEILEEELIVNMGMLGVTKLAELTPAVLAAARPVVQPHPLSAFPVAMQQIARSL